MGFHSWLVGAYKMNDVSVLFPTLVQFIKQNKYGGAGYTGQDIINDSGTGVLRFFQSSGSSLFKQGWRAGSRLFMGSSTI